MFGAAGLQAALWLVPLSVVRSQLALEQVRGFAYGALPAMMRMGGVLLAGVWLAASVHLTDRLMLVAVVGLLIAARIAAGRVASKAASRRTEKAQRLPLSAWLADVSAQKEPVRLAVSTVDTGMTSTGAWIRVLSGALNRGRVARAGRAWVLWWEPVQTSKSRAEWARLSAGTLRSMELVAGETGASALAEAQRRGLLPRELAQALGNAKTVTAHAELSKAASNLVPEARVIDLTGANALLANLRTRDLAMVRRAILAVAREQHHVPRSAPWQVAVYAPRGEVELVFVWPRGAAHGGKLARIARLASWRDSVSA
jgi:hypothetical protein